MDERSYGFTKCVYGYIGLFFEVSNLDDYSFQVKLLELDLQKVVIPDCYDNIFYIRNLDEKITHTSTIKCYNLITLRDALYENMPHTNIKG